MEYVYFLYCKTTQLVKIGRTVDLTRRLHCIATMCPTQLQAKFLEVSDSVSKEAELHRLFRDLRVRGEWFSFTEGLCSLYNSLELSFFSSYFPESPSVKVKDYSLLFEKKVKFLDDISCLLGRRKVMTYALIRDAIYPCLAVFEEMRKDCALWDSFCKKELSCDLPTTYTYFLTDLRLNMHRLVKDCHRKDLNICEAYAKVLDLDRSIVSV